MQNSNSSSGPHQYVPEDDPLFNKKVLLIEDDKLFQEIVKRTLEYSHCQLNIASDGKQALDFLNNQTPDIIIMDIKLQGNMDGITASQKIREFSDVPIIFITGNSDAESKERATAISNSDFLVKPVTEEKLREVVNRVFGEEEGAEGEDQE